MKAYELYTKVSVKDGKDYCFASLNLVDVEDMDTITNETSKKSECWEYFSYEEEALHALDLFPYDELVNNVG